ncbi:hypothetical protein Mgra_00004822 [Meloidogyne graminicola]|uniref:Transmembrane protein n=1 Tax=Meloidogyne graminicola TaxID=189291 RepID=A0A8S9ZQN7_9BILA|nr:hypothetical protein Mgra_00004822 [Meloidogyne graminicola]
MFFINKNKFIVFILVIIIIQLNYFYIPNVYCSRDGKLNGETCNTSGDCNTSMFCCNKETCFFRQECCKHQTNKCCYPIGISCSKNEQCCSGNCKIKIVDLGKIITSKTF